jgi:4-hydroxybenzoate polyprenyltransferase
MTTTVVRAGRNLGGRIVVFGHMIRFSHSVFALPFAFAGVLFAAHARGRFPGWEVWFWVIVAMVAARSAAMAFNRLADAGMDGANPRTRERAIPAGLLGRGTVWAFTAAAVAAFVLAAGMLNRLALFLSPLALAVVFLYSLTKRFTWATHLFLGLALGVAPVGGWVAVTGRLEAAPFLLTLGVLAWVGGFDIIYALQDLEFDRRHGVHSLPARFGPRRAIAAARGLHTVTVVVLGSLAWVLDLSPWYLAGVGLIALLLVYEHSLVKHDDLKRLDTAFFDLNAVISVLYGAAAAAGVLL